MNVSNQYRFNYIEQWHEGDLSTLPEREDDVHEFKGSSISDNHLSEELSRAASAFWNSDGGILVIGIEKNSGSIDGGISTKVGRQSRRDWVDQHIARTIPSAKYWVRLIEGKSSTSAIKPDHAVLVVGFEPSPLAPHMAFDNKYYIRAGAHSLPASHLLVESIRARIVLRSPILRAVLRRSERRTAIIELVVVVVNEATALEVEINFDPLPKLFLDRGEEFQSLHFPLQIPFIDKAHPFHIQIAIWGATDETFAERAVQMTATFTDLLGISHQHEQEINIKTGIDPLTLGKSDLQAIEVAVKDMSKEISRLRSDVSTYLFKKEIENKEGS